jgi:hypothetical protein
MLKNSNDFNGREWGEIIYEMKKFSDRTGIINGLTSHLDKGGRGEVPELCLLNGSCNKFVSINVNGDVFKSCIYQNNENYLSSVFSDDFQNRFFEYIDQLPEVNANSIYARTNYDDKFIYFQGDGCRHAKCKLNNEVFIAEILEYLTKSRQIEPIA